MTATVLVAELVVGGLQTLMWLAVLALFWYSPPQIVGQFRSLNASEGVVLVAMSYTVGVVFDRLWDALLAPLTGFIKRAVLKKPERVDKVRSFVFTKDPVRANFVDYIRSRLRVARATFCNATATAAAAAFVRNARASEPWSHWLTLVWVFFTILAVVSAFAYQDIARTYYETLDRLDAALKAER